MRAAQLPNRPINSTFAPGGKRNPAPPDRPVATNSFWPTAEIEKRGWNDRYGQGSGVPLSVTFLGRGVRVQWRPLRSLGGRFDACSQQAFLELFPAVGPRLLGQLGRVGQPITITDLVDGIRVFEAGVHKRERAAILRPFPKLYSERSAEAARFTNACASFGPGVVRRAMAFVDDDAGQKHGEA